MGLVAADWVIIINFVGGSCLIAISRPRSRGLKSTNWVVAALVARGISGPVSQWLSRMIRLPFDMYSFAHMLVSLVIGGILIGWVVRLVRASGLGFADRMLGLAFGFARGYF